MNWIRARLAEPSSYGGLAGLCLAACFSTMTFWSHWRWFGYAAAALFVIQMIKAEVKGQ
jgi:hypothetical protein